MNTSCSLCSRALVLLTVLFSGCDSKSKPTRLSAVLVTFDTTRADVLSPYGGPSDLTPHLDRLAAEGLLFEDASATAPLTLPSHASMMTGLYPPHHGLRENGIATLPPAAETLAESASAAGYQTAAFVSALVLDASFGLDQGFDVYNSPPKSFGSQSSHSPERPGNETMDRALDWLRARDRERPFFLWVHLFDPHGPYAPPVGFQPGKSTSIRALYMGEIRFADAQLGRLMDALEQDGCLDETFVAFTADHGEAFGEHGEPTHGAYVWETTIHVPLILRDPKGRKAGTKAQFVASVADVFPTLLGAMGLGQHEKVDGKNLMPLFEGTPLASDRGVYFESYSGYISYGWSQLAGWRDAGGKYIHSSRPQFFEPRKDPREADDLMLAGGDLGPRLKPYLLALARIGEDGAIPQGSGGVADSDLMEGIRGLGYAGVSVNEEDLPLPLEPSTRPSPQDNTDFYVAALQAQELSNQGEYEQAEASLMALLRRQPDSPFVLDRLASALVHRGEHAQAIPLLERLLKIGPGWAGSYCNLGLSYDGVGRVDEAILMLKRAIALDVNQEFFWDSLSAILERNGRTQELAELEAQRAQRTQD